MAFEDKYIASRYHVENQIGEGGMSVVYKAKVAKVTKAQVQEIAELKMKDLNAASIEAAMSMIAGTARSMGIEVVD